MIRFWRQNSNIFGAKIGRLKTRKLIQNKDFSETKVKKKINSCFGEKIVGKSLIRFWRQNSILDAKIGRIKTQKFNQNN